MTDIRAGAVNDNQWLIDRGGPIVDEPYTRHRREAVVDAQERNRTWWEQAPMTYAAWDAADRSTTRQRVVDDFLINNPWLTPDYFNRFAGKAVLEIGCGAGPATCLFAEGGAKVTAIDITDAAVQITRAYVEGLPVVVERMDAERTTFADASFDHVFSWGVLHHSANTEAAFAEVARVLKPGGTGLIMVYNRASLRYYVRGLQWLFLKGQILKGYTLPTVQRFFTDGYYHRHFTPKELTAALHGLRVERINMTHMAKKMVPGVSAQIDEKLKRRYGWLLVAEINKPLSVT